MAEGSEQFSFARHPLVERKCYFCGRDVFGNSKKQPGQNVADVREFPVPYFCCHDCFPASAKDEPGQPDYYLGFA